MNKFEKELKKAKKELTEEKFMKLIAERKQYG